MNTKDDIGYFPSMTRTNAGWVKLSRGPNSRSEGDTLFIFETSLLQGPLAAVSEDEQRVPVGAWPSDRTAFSGAGQLLGNLPDVARRIGEGRRATPPRPVQRTAQQGDAVIGQGGTDRIDVFDLDCQQKARSR